MSEKSKFETLYEAVMARGLPTPEEPEVIVERSFKPKTNPAKTKKPNAKKTRKTEHKRKMKLATDDRPIEHQRYDMKQTRGGKNQNFVSKYRAITHKTDMPTAKKVVNIAKKASSGIWKLSPRQVVEVAAKYKFNVPTQTKRIRHLGSTGIVLWRKNSKEYYLVKTGKNQRDGARYS